MYIATISRRQEAPQATRCANVPPGVHLSRFIGFNIVCAVFLIETVQTALVGADLYYWFVSGYGDVPRLSTFFAASFDVPITESVVSLVVQYFYAYRVWVLQC
ncbi:hypothetical protein BC826DRAFT_49278 [Russula brevipes]|nr:hypothetical protein BC826DRAFT_49278 [Russula brevipes]